MCMESAQQTIKGKQSQLGMSTSLATATIIFIMTSSMTSISRQAADDPTRLVAASEPSKIPTTQLTQSILSIYYQNPHYGPDFFPLPTFSKGPSLSLSPYTLLGLIKAFTSSASKRKAEFLKARTLTKAAGYQINQRLFGQAESQLAVYPQKNDEHCGCGARQIQYDKL